MPKVQEVIMLPRQQPAGIIEARWGIDSLQHAVTVQSIRLSPTVNLAQVQVEGSDWFMRSPVFENRE